MSMTTLAVGVFAGVFAADYVEKKFSAQLANVPGGGKTVTAGTILGTLYLAKKFLG